MEEEIIWCTRIKKGIKLTNPSKEEANSYYEKAIEDFELLKEEKFPKKWIPIVSYYIAYYSMYSLLREIGIKSENHNCSIKAFELILELINENKRVIRVIKKLKKKREEAQYYLKEVKINVNEVKEVVEFVKNVRVKILSNKEKIRNVFQEIIKSANEE